MYAIEQEDEAKWFRVKLYRNGERVEMLEFSAKNRHYAETIAIQRMKNTDANSIGAIDEISN